MDESVFRAALGVLLFAFAMHRAYYTRRIPPPSDPIERLGRTATSTVAVVAAGAAMCFTVAYWVGWDRMAVASMPFPSWLRWMGVVIFLAGLGLLEWAHRALGANWTDEPQITAEQKLVVSGPYRYIRHPIYAAFGLILGSVLLISANWLVGGAWIATWALAAADRIAYEERALESRFGADWVSYKAGTGRLLPRLRTPR